MPPRARRRSRRSGGPAPARGAGQQPASSPSIHSAARSRVARSWSPRIRVAASSCSRRPSSRRSAGRVPDTGGASANRFMIRRASPRVSSATSARPSPSRILGTRAMLAVSSAICCSGAAAPSHGMNRAVNSLSDPRTWRPAAGRGGGKDGGAGQSHRMPLGRTAPLAGAAVRPEAAVGDAQGLNDGDVEATAGRAQKLREGPQTFHDVPSRLSGPRLLAEVGDHALGPCPSALASLHQSLRQLIGDGRPVVRVGRDAEPCPPAEAAAPLPVVQGYQHDAVLGPVAEQVGQGIGQFGRCAQGHLMLPGQVVPIVRAPSAARARRVGRAVSPVPTAPADVTVTGHRRPLRCDSSCRDHPADPEIPLCPVDNPGHDHDMTCPQPGGLVRAMSDPSGCMGP